MKTACKVSELVDLDRPARGVLAGGATYEDSNSRNRPTGSILSIRPRAQWCAERKGIVRDSDKEDQDRDVRDEDEIERHEMNEA